MKAQLVFPVIPKPNWPRGIWNAAASNQLDVCVKQRLTEARIAYAFAQESTCRTIAEICRRIGLFEQPFYRWKSNIGSIVLAELHKLKQLARTRIPS